MPTKPASTAATTHSPTDMPSTLPVPITSHAVTSDDYPDLSIRLAEQGLVKIEYLVQSDGTVSECAVITSSGSSRLDIAACTMVKRRWRFRPATQNGKPVAEYLQADVSFTLVPSFEN
jgi:protein TonB